MLKHQSQVSGQVAMPSGSPEVEEAEWAAPVQRLPVVILVLYTVKPHILQNISDANTHAIGKVL